MNESQAIPAFSALAQETRLQIIRFLVRSGPNGSPAGKVGEEVGASSSRLSFHLNVLEQAGLVTATRVSRTIIYRADLQRLGALVGFLLEDCCSGHPTVRKCCEMPPSKG